MPFGLDWRATHPKVVQETSNGLTEKILKTIFANVAIVKAF